VPICRCHEKYHWQKIAGLGVAFFFAMPFSVTFFENLGGSMRVLVLVSVAALMAGCAAKVIDSNERMVMINAGSADPSGALRMAQSECAKYGRHARLSSKPNEDRQWTFDCIR
jgi:hypothetical protein